MKYANRDGKFKRSPDRESHLGELTDQLYRPPDPPAEQPDLFPPPALSLRARLDRIPAVYRSDLETVTLQLLDLVDAYGPEVVRQAFRAAARAGREAS